MEAHTLAYFRAALTLSTSRAVPPFRDDRDPPITNGWDEKLIVSLAIIIVFLVHYQG
jgi:hypothetical protein